MPLYAKYFVLLVYLPTAADVKVCNLLISLLNAYVRKKTRKFTRFDYSLSIVLYGSYDKARYFFIPNQTIFIQFSSSIIHSL